MPQRTNKLIGGVSYGFFNFTWPFASLYSDNERLIISVFKSPAYQIPFSQINAIQRFTVIPYLFSGITIAHTLPHESKRPTFWYFGKSETILSFLKEQGILHDQLS